MKKLEQLYEGKAKKVFATDEDGVVIVDYKDDATAFNGEKKGTIMGKGVVNNKMSNYVFGLLEKDGVPTHFIKELSDRETAVKKVSIVPLEVIVRNVAAGSFSKRMGVPEGKELLCPILEFSYKNDELGDPFINDDYALALGLATQDEIDTIKNYTRNAALGVAGESSLTGMSRQTRSSIRTASAAISAMWKKLTTKYSVVSALKTKQFTKAIYEVLYV